MPGEPKTAAFVDLQDTRVRYLDRGTGPAVVMLHGFASALENWAPVIPALEKRHRVLALDLKGFGWTDRPPGDYSPQAQADLVLALMDARGIKKAAIVAHSWGSSVALALALKAPDRVTRLALYDAWVYEEQQPTFFQWSRAAGVGEVLFGLYYNQRAEDRLGLAFYDKSFVTEELIAVAESHLEKPGTTAAHLAAVRGQRYGELETHYREVKQKTLLLYGREDVVTTVKYGERLLRELPNARMVVYPRCGHFPMLEAAKASTRDLHAFLLEDEGAAAASTSPAKPKAQEPTPEPKVEKAP